MSDKAEIEKQVLYDLGLTRHSCHRCGLTFPMFDHLQEHRENEHGEEEAA